ncbi:uncharacterized protein LOC144429878 [Styela clava]
MNSGIRIKLRYSDSRVLIVQRKRIKVGNSSRSENASALFAHRIEKNSFVFAVKRNAKFYYVTLPRADRKKRRLTLKSGTHPSLIQEPTNDYRVISYEYDESSGSYFLRPKHRTLSQTVIDVNRNAQLIVRRTAPRTAGKWELEEL